MSNNETGKRELYRDPSRAKISGVCAGISDYFDLEVWVVRIIAVSALLLFQVMPVLFAYGVAHLILEPKPGATRKRHGTKYYAKGRKRKAAGESDTASAVNPEKATVQQIWKKGRIPSQTIRKVNERFKGLDSRLQNMETYVTSRQFQLRREFNDLQ